MGLAVAKTSAKIFVCAVCACAEKGGSGLIGPLLLPPFSALQSHINSRDTLTVE